MILPIGSKVYIAGPMRGHALFNFQKFFYWAEVLEQSGYEVLNPAAFDVDRMMKDGWQFDEDNYEEVLEFDLKVIEEAADALFMLKGWGRSEGAGREYARASELGLAIFDEPPRLNITVVLEIP
jgi:hypothetical protein